jgi:cytochrome c oxidase assembly factor CtaG
MLHLICMPLLVLLASPLLILIAPFYLFQLRRLEKTDPEPYIVVDDDHFETLARRKIMMLRTRTVRWVA